MARPIYLLTSDYNAISAETGVVADGLTLKQLIEKYGDVVLVPDDTQFLQSQRNFNYTVGIPAGVFKLLLIKAASLPSNSFLDTVLGTTELIPVTPPVVRGNQIFVFHPNIPSLFDRQHPRPSVLKGTAFSITYNGLVPSRNITLDFINPADGTVAVASQTVASSADGIATITFTIPATYTGARVRIDAKHISVLKTDTTPNAFDDITAKSSELFVVS